jgi:hypothetical protein
MWPKRRMLFVACLWSQFCGCGSPALGDAHDAGALEASAEAKQSDAPPRSAAKPSADASSDVAGDDVDRDVIDGQGDVVDDVGADVAPCARVLDCTTCTGTCIGSPGYLSCCP